MQRKDGLAQTFLDSWRAGKQGSSLPAYTLAECSVKSSSHSSLQKFPLDDIARANFLSSDKAIHHDFHAVVCVQKTFAFT